MVCITTIFVRSVLIFYLLYRYKFKQSELAYKEMLLVYSEWEVFDLVLILTVIYTAHLVTCEVSTINTNIPVVNNLSMSCSIGEAHISDTPGYNQLLQ